jgi:site-specific DNA-cytosine methylase
VIETVPRGFTVGRDFLLKKALQLQKRGYKTHLFLHTTLWMGSVQNRKRLFFVASRVKWEPLDEPWSPGQTVNEVLGKVTEKGEVLWPMPKTWRKFWDDQGDPKRGKAAREDFKKTGLKPTPAFMNYRLPGDKHMGAFCGNYYLHPTEFRTLTMPECRALCGYPESYSFPDQHSYMRCCTVFAQAVMPWAGDHIARSVVVALKKNQPVEKTREVVSWDWRVAKKEQTLYDTLEG